MLFHPGEVVPPQYFILPFEFIVTLRLEPVVSDPRSVKEDMFIHGPSSSAVITGAIAVNVSVSSVSNVMFSTLKLKSSISSCTCPISLLMQVLKIVS